MLFSVLLFSCICVPFSVETGFQILRSPEDMNLMVSKTAVDVSAGPENN
jgi:hypothetical protein